jgi:hypothetical protein
MVILFTKFTNSSRIFWLYIFVLTVIFTCLSFTGVCNAPLQLLGETDKKLFYVLLQLFADVSNEKLSANVF